MALKQQNLLEKMKSKIPIIALTADVTSVDIKKSLEIGMNDYISKPIDEKLLYNKINELLMR
jgi:two-component system CheB/CheR fusion protein